MTTIVALDVGYSTSSTGVKGRCGVVAFGSWTAPEPTHELTLRVDDVQPYVPGRLYERELPCLVAGLRELERQADVTPDIVVIDGNVRLDQQSAPGLGMHLYQHLGETTPVIGVAKNAYVGLDATPVTRGTSAKPLYVTAIGMGEVDAAKHVASMAGEFRLPTLLKLADRLTRGPEIDEQGAEEWRACGMRF